MARYTLALLACLPALLALAAATNTEDEAVSSSNRTVERFIVGGKSTFQGQFPSTVYLSITLDDGSYACGGVIIDERWVLTAAHCCTNDNGRPGASNSVTVMSGTRDIRSGGARTRSDRVIVHSGYRPSPASNGAIFSNDIALVRLSQRIPFNSNTRPAVLQRTVPGDGAGVTVAGWGRTNPTDTRSSSPVLLYTDLNVLGNSRCRSQLGRTVLNEQLCTAEDSSHTCQGDSGGPLYINGNNAVGLVSFGGSPCGRGPTVFTNIPWYINWIRQNTGLNL